MSLYRCSSQAGLNVPISEESTNDDDAISQVTQVDDVGLECTQNPTQSKTLPENLAEEMRKLQREEIEFEKKSAELEQRIIELSEQLKKEASLVHDLEASEADVHRIEAEIAEITEHGCKLKAKITSLDSESKTLREACDKLEAEIQRIQVKRLNAICHLHIKTTREFRIAFAQRQEGSNLFDSKLPSYQELQDGIAKLQTDIKFYEELNKSAMDTMDRIEESVGTPTDRSLSEEDRSNLLKFIKTAKGLHIERLGALAQSVGRFSRGPLKGHTN